MNGWLEFGLSNGVAATLLALAAVLATRFDRRPQVAFVLWLLVLGKLLVPPVVGLPLASLRTYFEPAKPIEQHHAGRWLLNVPPTIDFEFFDEKRADGAERADAAPIDLPARDSTASGALPLEDFAELSASVDALLLEHAAAYDDSTDGANVPDIPIEPLQDAALFGRVTVGDKAVASISRYEWLLRALGWTWLGGAGLWFSLAAARMVHFARVLRRAKPADAPLQDEVRRLAKQMGLAHPPRVRLSRRRVPPLVWAMSGQPTMLLPVELLDGLSRRQRETLLAHELAHLARRDYLVRWLELAALGFYWWHPVAWWARHNVAVAEEQCCDARVVALLPDSARAYAETLLATVEFLAEPARPLPVGASGFSRLGHIQRRLTMILKQTTTRQVAWPLRVGLVAVALAVLPVSLHTLWAEPAAESEATVEVAEVEAVVEPAVEVVGVEDVSEPAQAAESVLAADEVEQVEVAESVEETEAVVATEPAIAADTAEPDKGSSVEQRLGRLEAMIEKLTVAFEPKRESRDQSAKRAKRSPSEAHRKTGTDERSHEFERELANEMVNLMRNASLNFTLSRTNQSRYAAAERQFRAVFEAYKSKTVSLDEVLEAIRRRADARSSYGTTVIGMAASPARRDYLNAYSSWVVADEAIRATRHLLDAAAAQEASPHELDQCREQYLHFQRAAIRAFTELKTDNIARYRLGAPAAMPTSPRAMPSRTITALHTKGLVDREEESMQALAVLRSQARVFVEEIDRARDRLEYCEGELEKSMKTYDNGTIGVDEVVRALQVRMAARMSYAKTVSALSNDERTENAVALDNVAAVKQARRDTKKLWGDLADRGAPQRDLQKVRVLYDHLEENVKIFEQALRQAQVQSADRSGGQKSRGSATAKAVPTMEAELTARALDIQDHERYLRAQRKNAESKLSKLEKMKADIEKELAEQDDQLRARREELEETTVQLRQRLDQIESERAGTAKLHEAKNEKIKRRAEEKRKLVEKFLNERQEKAKPADGAPKKPKDGDGAQRSIEPVLGAAVLAVQALEDSNQVLAEARVVWKEAYKKYSNTPGSAGIDEAQAREHYFDAKSETQAVLANLRSVLKLQ